MTSETYCIYVSYFTGRPTDTLVVTPTARSTLGERVFSVAEPRAWNGLVGKMRLWENNAKLYSIYDAKFSVHVRAIH